MQHTTIIPVHKHELENLSNVKFDWLIDVDYVKEVPIDTPAPDTDMN